MRFPEIEMRARLATRIKQAVYPHEPWPKVVAKVADRINDLRRIARPYYPDMPEMDFLAVLVKYDDEAIREAFAMVPEGEPSAIGHILSRCGIIPPS